MRRFICRCGEFCPACILIGVLLTLAVVILLSAVFP